MQTIRPNKIRNRVSQLLARLVPALLGVVLCGVCIALAQKGGSVSKPRFEAPAGKQRGQEEAALPYSGQEASSPVSSLKQKHETRLMAIDGVEGVGIGQDQIGDEALVVYVRDQGVATRVSQALKGVPLQIIVTGPIEALRSSQ